MHTIIPFIPFHEVWDGAAISKEDWHFHQRLFEHYAIVLRPKEFSYIVKYVLKDRKGIVETKKHSWIHRVYIYSAREYVYIAANRKALLTVLPDQLARKRYKRLKPK